MKLLHSLRSRLVNVILMFGLSIVTLAVFIYGTVVGLVKGTFNTVANTGMSVLLFLVLVPLSALVTIGTAFLSEEQFISCATAIESVTQEFTQYMNTKVTT